MDESRENFSSKWVHPDKFFNGCIQRKLFFKIGAFTKTFAAKLMHQDKTLFQNGCIKFLSFTEFRKRIILSFYVSLHVIKASLLM